ncbi:hypothetical protein M413DRAFT_144468 [Hebeloma cylindrosporum]|uniref:F-box domain-containing protein n=1 Tax=Hebeloma cylindrosporum TaxID=76867 RepID=A0A0C2YJL0_HEBCY|nr:hypothetical protein M413DRAFT_144468 [Hebeloma cylindrosporum h7]
MVEHDSSVLVVALSNKDRLSLSEPETYTSIRCKLGDNVVWEHLLSNPTCAAHVRELEIQREDLSRRGIMDEEDPFLTPRKKTVQEITTAPEVSTSEQVVHSEQLLMKAIRLMVNLESFTWDRWVPEVNQGEEIQAAEYQLHYETHRGDIWTALRASAKLERLTVVDLGRAILRPTNIPVDVRSIFSSTIFTLSNLTHLDLKMFYSPADEMEGSYGEYEDEDGDEELLPGRVKWERLHDLLSRCPNLKSLSLAIYDHDFYYKCGGNPYTNITPIFSKLMGYWHHLSSLKLRDIVVSDSIMATFLKTHTNLRNFSMSLSLEDELPELPFDLESYVTDLSRNEILSNIESLYISPPRALRPILRSLRRPSPRLRSLGTLEPCDWNASEELHADENYVSSLDDVWGYNSPATETQMMEDGSPSPGGSRELSNLLSGISNVRSLVVTDVKDLRQLDKLVRATPELETIVFRDSFEYLASHAAPHTELVSYLSHWSRLTTLYGVALWPSTTDDDSHLDVSSEFVLSIARDVVAQCPLLQHVSWIDGTPLTIVKENGELRLESLS